MSEPNNVFQNIWAGETTWSALQASLVAAAAVNDSTETLNKEPPSPKQPSTSTQEAPEVENSGSRSACESPVSCLVNTPDRWFAHLVEQGEPWDTSEIDDEEQAALAQAAALKSGGTGQNFHSRTRLTKFLSKRATSTAISGAAVSQESNVWTSEPPTGTGIWETHGKKVPRLHQPQPVPIVTAQSPISSAQSPRLFANQAQSSSSNEGGSFWGEFLVKI